MKEKENNEQLQKNEVLEDLCVNSQDELEELKNLKKELDSQKEKFLRIAAEYDNYRKRTERDRLTIYHDAIAKAITEILPVADSLNIAVKAEDGANEDYKKGLELVNDQFVSSLKKLSVESFGEPGDEFNPEIHNAIAHIEDEDLDDNVITEVFQLGYKVGDKIIRHAMVKVAN